MKKPCFADIVSAKRGELEDLVRRRMPVIAGRMAKNHFQDNFRKGGFVNGGLHPWKPAWRLSAGGTSAYFRNGTLLSGSDHLFNSVNYYPGDSRVRVASEVAYAPVHNWGASIERTDRMRRYAWHRFFSAAGVAKNEPAESRRKKTAPGAVAPNPEARFWRGMALSKKQTVRIPQRQFLGESRELQAAVAERLETEILKILNN